MFQFGELMNQSKFLSGMSFDLAWGMAQLAEKQVWEKD